MTEQISSIEINLVPLNLFTRHEGMPPHCQSAANIVPDPDLMMFSIMPRRSATPFADEALRARKSAFTLYVTGTQFELFCYSFAIDRLVKDIEEQSAPMHFVLH